MTEREIKAVAEPFIEALPGLRVWHRGQEFVATWSPNATQYLQITAYGLSDLQRRLEEAERATLFPMPGSAVELAEAIEKATRRVKPVKSKPAPAPEAKPQPPQNPYKRKFG